MLSLFMLSLAGCAPSLRDLATRASYEMNCPVGELVMEELMRNTWGVSGCGQRETYVRIGRGLDARWVANTGGNAGVAQARDADFRADEALIRR